VERPTEATTVKPRVGKYHDIFENIKILKMLKYHDIFYIFAIFDIFQKMKISNEL